LKQLIINNVEFNVGNFEEKTITHSTTGEQLKETLTLDGKEEINT